MRLIQRTCVQGIADQVWRNLNLTGGGREDDGAGKSLFSGDSWIGSFAIGRGLSGTDNVLGAHV